MKLYFISQSDNNGYDTYDSAVVAAESEMKAAKIHPGSDKEYFNAHSDWGIYGGWANSYKSVDVVYIGEAAPNMESGVILASFNAG